MHQHHHTTRWRGARRLALAVAIAIACSLSAAAATYTVTTTSNAGAGSLRQVIVDANTSAGADTVIFNIPGSGPHTITLTTGQMLVTDHLAIIGSGALLLNISGNDSSRVFNIAVSINVSISGVTITHGHATAPGESGGAIISSGNLTLRDCAFTDNVATRNGGAIAVFASSAGPVAGTSISGCTFTRNQVKDGGNGTAVANGGFYTTGAGVLVTDAAQMTITNSTFSGNTGIGYVWGTLGNSGTFMKIVNSTITGNSCTEGGGVFVYVGTVTVLNSIIAGNTVAASGPYPANGPDVARYVAAGSGSFASAGHNLIGDKTGTASAAFTHGVSADLVGQAPAIIDPVLGPLQNNGGPTDTHAPLCASPAIDAGDNAVTGAPWNLATDQRGLARQSHGPVDIGAYEAVIAGTVVTNTLNTGPGSLRNAIAFANGNAGADVITFCIAKTDPGFDPLTGAYTIIPVGGLPALGSDLVVDGWSQPGFAGTPIIELNGSSSPGNFGFVINNAQHVTVRGFVINRYAVSSGNGIGIGMFGAGSTNNWINGCYIGTNVAGTAAQANGQIGIWVSNGPSNNLFGSNADGVDDAMERNVISGNGRSAIEINSNNNVVAGNYLGVNAAGIAALANGESGVRFLGSATGNIVGGSVSAARNVLSGNAQYGVLLQSPATGNLVQGNAIGTNAAASAGVPNGAGIGIFADGNTIGGTGASARNIISGNNAAGIYVFGNTNIVQGNYIGTDASGLAAVPNAASIFHTAIWCSGNNNLIGGTAAGAGNVVSGNNHYGIFVGYTNATGNVVQGNYIGVNAAGTAALGNRLEGVFLDGPGNTVGGTTAAARNIISGSLLEDGVEITNTNNLVQGNAIGTDITGAVALPNAKTGVFVNGATNATIGGTTAGAGNLISGNATQGVLVTGAAMNASILGNSIVGNGALGIDLGGAGNTGNDAADGDGGPNDLQNYPIIVSTSDVCGNATVHGTLNSSPNSTYLIEVFTNTACDPSAFGEGQALLGTLTATTDVNGDATFALPLGVPLPLGAFLTATATSASGSTSEFSQCHTVVAPDIDVPVIAHAYGNVDLGDWADYSFAIDNTGTGPLTISGITIGGANAAEFSVQNPPASPVPPSGSSTLVVRFSPTTAPLAIKNATVTIASDDPCGNENPVTIALTGYGVPALPPYLLLAKQKIEIDAQTNLEGDIRSNDEVGIKKGKPSTYTSTIWAVDEIEIEKDNAIVGDLQAANISLQSGVTVSGTQTFSAAPVYAFPSMAYTAGSTNVTVPSNGSYTLAPGSYKDVKVENGGTLFLSSGVYFMKKLEVKKNGEVAVDITNGTVRCNVVEKITFDKETEVSISPLGANGTGWLTFNSLGGVSIDKDSRVLGNINALYEKVQIKKDVSYKGAISAKEISIDKDGTTLHHSSALSLPKTGARGEASAEISSFTLEQNYPNPFNPATVIAYTIRSAERVTLRVFDPMGRELETLVDADLEPGSYRAEFNGAAHQSGVYVYQLTVGGQHHTRSMTLLK